MSRKAFSRTLDWKYYTKVNISRLSEVISAFFQPSECVAAIVVGVDHFLPKCLLGLRLLRG